jgi:hypothetical protein
MAEWLNGKSHDANNKLRGAVAQSVVALRLSEPAVLWATLPVEGNALRKLLYNITMRGRLCAIFTVDVHPKHGERCDDAQNLQVQGVDTQRNEVVVSGLSGTLTHPGNIRL